MSRVILVPEEIEHLDFDLIPSQYCHILHADDHDLALCGAGPIAWVSCPFEDYLMDDVAFCKCNKPLCPTCESIFASHQNR